MKMMKMMILYEPLISYVMIQKTTWSWNALLKEKQITSSLEIDISYPKRSIKE
jgi:hypothetical protein